MVAQRPTHISLPPPRFSPDDPDGLTPPFYTAPSTPDQIFYTPPSSPPAFPFTAPHDDPQPSVEFAIDLALSDDTLSTLERIYLFSRSKAVFHRVFITHALPSFLNEVSPQEANEYVLPLLTGLAMDDEEQVKEVLAAQLIPIIWWFFTHCQVVSDESSMDAETYQSRSELAATAISVQAFTPILGTLLLSPNPLVGGVARYAVVALLERVRKANDKDSRILSVDGPSPRQGAGGEDVDFDIGLFGRRERAMFQEEILQQVVIGMGHLDVDPETSFTPDDTIVLGRSEQPEVSERQSQKGTVNPYFPASSLSSSDHSFPSVVPNNSRSLDGLQDLPNSNSLFLSTALKPISHDAFSDHVTSPTLKQLPTKQTSLSTNPANIARVPSADGIASTVDRSSLPIGPLNPPKSGRVSPDLIDPLPSTALEGLDSCNKRNMEYGAAHNRTFRPSWNCTCDDAYGYDDCENQKAAVGRLSSMSLMAAVVASGPLDEEIKRVFVKEVERAAQDPVSWVRTEASFAVGALAKVVPKEVVQCSMLPLFDLLRCDTTWRVRHSSVFALPAILTRLHPRERRKLALETILHLATDENATVRLGVLEVLGEVLYTFRGDDEGVPDDVLNLFLGKKIDRGCFPIHHPSRQNENRLDLFLQEPRRPLICAFNYPAVVLALGKERWDDVRGLYLILAADTELKVQRTLTASLGELAKIIGEGNAQRDLVKVWWNAIRSEEEEVRLKAVEVVETFSAALGPRVGASIIEGILTVWDEGIFKSWRERDCVAKSLVNLSHWGQEVMPSVIYGLLRRALEDNVASVRESGVIALPHIWKIFSHQPDFLSRLQAYMFSLANATAYRKRMTFIACQRSLIMSNKQTLCCLNDELLDAIDKLADDGVEGVRIGVARLLGIICG
ncbi:hypothetical protein AX15_003890 [Amanita polypyramis BW_CC]|nr:hypothetical protein AX15_003890 [Amanita polypyramis BW_CC]